MGLCSTKIEISIGLSRRLQKVAQTQFSSTCNGRAHDFLGFGNVTILEFDALCGFLITQSTALENSGLFV